MVFKKYFAGSRKKRELSDNSTNDGDPKEQHEGSLNDSRNCRQYFR